MTRDSDSEGKEPLNRLVNRPEVAKQLRDREPRNSIGINPLKILNEAQGLDRPQNQVLVEVLKQGRVTAADVAEELELSAERAGNVLSELELGGYLDRQQINGQTEYRISSVWGSEEFPSGPIIPLVYQYNLLSDEHRMRALKEAIEAVVEEGDVVADLGAGAGILSHLASQHAAQVYAVEVDPDVYERGREFVRERDRDNVDYIRADARTVSLPEPVDVVLCEMLDTALAAELQVPVMNHAVDELLAEGGRSIPHDARTTIRLVNSDYSFFGSEFRLPHFEAYGSRESTDLSAETVYHEVDFTEQNDLAVDETVMVTAESDGVVNGVQLNTYVRFAPGLDYTGPSEWLDPPLTLPTREDLTVTAGDELRVDLRYRLGGGLNDIEHNVSRVE